MDLNNDYKTNNIKKQFTIYVITLFLIVITFYSNFFEIKNVYGYTSNAGSNIQLNVFFCNVDLNCDPEENYVSCPSDCPIPITPSSTPTSTPISTSNSNGTGRSGSGNSNAFNIFNTVGDATTQYSTVFYSRNFFGNPLLFWDIKSLNNGSIYNLYSKPTVRILRSTTGFPYSPDSGGVIVYEGDGTTLLDKSAPKNTFVFYTLFIKNNDESIKNNTTIFSWPIFATFAPENYFSLLLNNIRNKNDYVNILNKNIDQNVSQRIDNFFEKINNGLNIPNMCRIAPELPGDYLDQKFAKDNSRTNQFANLFLFLSQIFVDNIFVITLLFPFLILIYLLIKLFYKK